MPFSAVQRIPDASQESPMKLTEISISKLKSNGADTIHYDDELNGFGVRIREGGSRNYVVRYRLGGHEKRYTIGAVSVLSLAEARKRARKALVAIDEGKDPTAEKATKREAASLTLGTVASDYLEAIKSTMKPRSHVEVSRHLLKVWKPLHRLAIGSIGRPTIAARLREVAKDRGNTAANRARATLSAMYAWSIGEGLCEANPVIGTNKMDEGKPRDRVLSDAELAAIWNAAPEGDYGSIVRLLMLTAQRRDEIGSLRWSEIDLKAKTITLPASRTKNGREHIIPLSPEALAILKATPQRLERELVFGSGGGGYSGWSKSKQAMDDKLKGVAAWTLHDLRRTGATRMADSGVQPHIIEAVLNHVSGHKGGVAGIYNRSTYEPEKRAALDTLGGYIKTAIAKAQGANVTRLKRAQVGK